MLIIKNKKGQVWVETVIYTLIGIILIGTVLAFATPAIKKQQDNALIERTRDALHNMDTTVLSVKNLGVSNAREINLVIKRGSLIVDGVNDLITFEVDEISNPYSEIRTTVEISGTNIKARTDESGSKYIVELTLDYKNIVNITYNGKDEVHTLNPSNNPYRLLIENGGKIPYISGAIPNYTNINIYDAS